MPLIRTIAVGFDGSGGARSALEWASELATQVGAEIAVMHAIGLLEHATDHGLVTELEDEARAVGRERGMEPERLRWHPVDGDPCSALVRSAGPPIGADLLVVGSRGQGGHSGLLLGSTSHELAEHAPVPLVIVPMSG
jgi:nucleotide-binding universal stress UspA family protein